MTEKEAGIRKLKRGKLREGETAINIQIQPRVGKIDYDRILELTRSQFPHGTRRKRENSQYLCTQRTPTDEDIAVWLRLQPTALATQLLKPGVLLRVDLEEWEVGDRQLPPNGNRWSAVVSVYAGKKATRFRLTYIDPQATRVDCCECGSLGWECDKTCACGTACKIFTVEAG
eukprot:3813458-Rhodomonas_salina.1